MLLKQHALCASLLSLFAIQPLQVQAATNSKVDDALRIVNTLCLSGTEYAFEADATGNITFKNFSPKGKGSVTLNARESFGATAFQDSMRMINDDKVRECTQRHIGRVLDAVLETVPQKDSGYVYGEKVDAHSSFKTAKFIGVVPGKLKAFSIVEGNSEKYFRFSVSTPSDVELSVTKHKSTATIDLYSTGHAYISGSKGKTRTGTEAFLMPGDYYVKLKARSKDTAISFQLTVTAQGES